MRQKEFTGRRLPKKLEDEVWKRTETDKVPEGRAEDPAGRCQELSGHLCLATHGGNGGAGRARVCGAGRQADLH